MVPNDRFFIFENLLFDFEILMFQKWNFWTSTYPENFKCIIQNNHDRVILLIKEYLSLRIIRELLENRDTRRRSPTRKMHARSPNLYRVQFAFSFYSVQFKLPSTLDSNFPWGIRKSFKLCFYNSLKMFLKNFNESQNGFVPFP